MRIARADIDAGVIEKDASSTGRPARPVCLRHAVHWSSCRRRGVGRRGRTDRRVLSGRRSGRFVLDLNAAIAPERIALAAKGKAGRRGAAPQLTSLTRWLAFGADAIVVWRRRRCTGSFGGGNLTSISSSRVPLSLIDVVRADTGLGGTISGAIDYRTSANGLPVSDATVKIEGLTRSGLVLTSRPVNVALVARLTEDELATRAILGNSDIQRGRVQARITGLPRQGVLIDRLRGPPAATATVAGRSLWRLAALDTFDITGIAIAADASGTLQDPTVRGSLSGDALNCAARFRAPISAILRCAVISVGRGCS